jgi:hypothetical protein
MHTSKTIVFFWDVALHLIPEEWNPESTFSFSTVL